MQFQKFVLRKKGPNEDLEYDFPYGSIVLSVDPDGIVTYLEPVPVTIPDVIG